MNNMLRRKGEESGLEVKSEGTRSPWTTDQFRDRFNAEARRVSAEARRLSTEMKRLGERISTRTVGAVNNTNSTAVVLCGPVVGSVTDTTANILLEIDENAQLRVIATPTTLDGGTAVIAEKRFSANGPGVIQLVGLQPGTTYHCAFEGVNPADVSELEEVGCIVKTFPPDESITKLRLVAMSCDRPRRLLQGEENPYDRLVSMADSEEGVDLMIHLGDQVYTKMDGFLERAEAVMDNYQRPNATQAVKDKLLNHATEELRRSYRHTWNQSSCRKVMARTPHYMIWSDNDVANDFTEKENKDGTQYYSQQLVEGGMRVYTEYQRQLWDPSCNGHLPTDRSGKMEEWHFHQHGGLGVFMLDMRGNRITVGGEMVKMDALPDGHVLMSEKQKKALEDAFAAPGVSCMVIGAEIPFVSDPPAVCQKTAKKIKFLEGHWAYHEKETTWLYDLCFNWKAAQAGREVLLIGGDIHVGVDTVLKDNSTGDTIRSITASPITNHVCKFFSKLEGNFSDRYSYEHTVLPDDARNFCVIDVEFEDGGKACKKLTAKLEAIPTDPNAEECD